MQIPDCRMTTLSRDRTRPCCYGLAERFGGLLDLADRVHTVEPRRRRRGHEELQTIGVRPALPHRRSRAPGTMETRRIAEAALRRSGEPEEIAAALYLAPDASGFNTGPVIRVDGGAPQLVPNRPTRQAPRRYCSVSPPPTTANQRRSITLPAI